MQQKILIAGNSSEMLNSLVEKAVDRQFDILVAQDEEEKEKPDDTSGQSPSRFLWNRRSPLASRSILLECLNTFGNIDEAILVCAPSFESEVFHTTSVTRYEDIIDSFIKSYIFLSKELIGYFLKKGTGGISFVYYSQEPDILTPLNGCVLGGFKSFAQSLFPYYQNESFYLRGFQSTTSQLDDFSEYIFGLLSESNPKNRAKWHRFSGKSGLMKFGGLKPKSHISRAVK
jgi:hypothetical protein